MRYIREIFILSWTLAGSAYILATLPPGSDTFRYAAIITCVAFVMHMVSGALDRDDDDD
ncbi:MAG: hypothetical protein ACO3NB_10985 [Ilumatobacteraceae bacterium]